MTPATALSPAVLGALRSAARQDAGPFVDPTVLREYTQARASLPGAWLAAVLGRPLNGTPLRWPEILLVVRARRADQAHLDHIAQAKAAAARQPRTASAAAADADRAAERQAWTLLRASLPVAVHVGHNWTIGHHETHRTGRDHIVVQEPLTLGRLRRSARQALCETPSTRTGLRLDPLRALDRTPEQSGPTDQPNRLPTCQRCLRIARSISTAPSALAAP